MAKFQRMLDAYSDHGMTALHLAELSAHKDSAGAEMVGMLLVAGASDLPMRPCKVGGCHGKCGNPLVEVEEAQVIYSPSNPKPLPPIVG